jgi:renalase
MQQDLTQGFEVLVIGAGVAGLACARRLAAGGARVVVVDKGRGPGGRLSTRRVATALGEVGFDHGAQFLTARDPDFSALTRDWLARGLLAPWNGVVRLAADGTNAPLSGDPLLVGVPGMNASMCAGACGSQLWNAGQTAGTRP